MEKASFGDCSFSWSGIDRWVFGDIQSHFIWEFTGRICIVEMIRKKGLPESYFRFY